MSLADALDAIPLVTNATERAARFPAPQTGQRVHNLQTQAIERWNGSWVTDFQAMNALGSGINVQATPYNADPTGAIDAAAAIQAACDAAAVTGAFVQIPPGSYKMTAALNIKKNTRVYGVRNASILDFNGATDGVVISDSGNPFPQGIILDGFVIRTSNAAGGKALYVNTPTNGASGNTFHDIDILKTGSGRWAFGFWASNFESAEIFSLHIFSSATIALHLEAFCNALKFYGTEITGGNVGDTSFLRGIEIVNTTDAAFFGATVQGCFGQSAINLSGGGTGAIFNFVHVENTYATPSDGADVVVNGCSDTCFNDIQGGSFSYTGTIRGGTILGGNFGAVAFAAGCIGVLMLGCRCVSITDSGKNSWLQCRNGAGSDLVNKFGNVEFLTQTFTGAAPVIGTPNSAAVAAWPNAAIVCVKDPGGTYRDVWIPLSGASQMLFTYLASTGAIIFRSTTPTTRMQINDSGVGIGAAGTLLAEVKKYSPSLTPASVNANTIAEQTFSVAGLVAGDNVTVTGPAQTAGIGILGCRASATDTLAITFINNTAGALTPAAGFYRVTGIR